MKVALVGSRFFGASVLEALRQVPGVEFSCVVTIAADDRLALAALKPYRETRLRQVLTSSSPRTHMHVSVTKHLPNLA
jgi:hypothetical protein